MGYYTDERFEFIFERLCELTVELNSIDREVKTAVSVLDKLELGADEYFYPQKSLEEMRSALLGLRARRDKTRRDYDYYYGLYSTKLVSKNDDELRSSVLVFSKKEEELNDERAELEATGGSLEEINKLKELAKVYFDYIESIHAFMDSRNDLKLRSKTPR